MNTLFKQISRVLKSAQTTNKSLHKSLQNQSHKSFNIYIKPVYQPENKLGDEKVASQLFKNYNNQYFNVSPKEFQDFFKLVEKYSRSFYTKIPFIGQKIIEKKFQYENYELQQDMKVLMDRIVQNMPRKSFKLQLLFETFEYPRKLQFPKLVTEFSKTMAQSQNMKIDPLLQQKIQDLAYVLENINIGLFLHNTVDSIEDIKQLATNSMQQKLMEKLSDKKLILIGDYYHVMGSSESSKIGLIEIPMYMSTIEEEFSKGVCMRSDLKSQYNEQKKSKDFDIKSFLKLQDIYDLAYYNTANIAGYACLATSLLMFDSNDQKLLDESFQVGFDMGLAMQFQHDMHKFVALWPASFGQLILHPSELYTTGFNLPNYALVQQSSKKNKQELHFEVLKFCDMHIENLKNQAKDRVENLGGDFTRLNNLYKGFLNQL